MMKPPFKAKPPKEPKRVEVDPFSGFTDRGASSIQKWSPNIKRQKNVNETLEKIRTKYPLIYEQIRRDPKKFLELLTTLGATGVLTKQKPQTQTQPQSESKPKTGTKTKPLVLPKPLGIKLDDKKKKPKEKPKLKYETEEKEKTRDILETPQRPIQDEEDDEKSESTRSIKIETRVFNCKQDSDRETQIL